MRYFRLLAALALTLLVVTTPSADIFFYNEDWEDWDENGQPLPEGTLFNGSGWSWYYSYYYDQYANPPDGKYFDRPWTHPAGSGVWELVEENGNMYFQIYGTGIVHDDYSGLPALHHTPIAETRLVHELPLVTEMKFRPADYNPSGDYAAQDPYPEYAYREMACKFRWFYDFPDDSERRMKYRLYYDGTLMQMYADGPWDSVDIGGKDDAGNDGDPLPYYPVWDGCNLKTGENGFQTQDKWLYFRLLHDPIAGKITAYLGSTDDPLTPCYLVPDGNGLLNPVRDENGNIVDENGNIWDEDKMISEFTEEEEGGLPWTRIRMAGDLQPGADQTATYDPGQNLWKGDSNMDGSKAHYDDYKIYFLGDTPKSHWIACTVKIEYPHWLYYQLENLAWQMREPGLPPKEPLAMGEKTVQLWDNTVYPGSETHAGLAAHMEDMLVSLPVGLASPGTYDVAFKLPNRLAAVAQNVVVPPGKDENGVPYQGIAPQVSLYPGDISGQFVNYLDGQDNPVCRPDNDCDWYDGETLSTEADNGYTYKKKHPALPMSLYPRESGDLDADMLVTQWDENCMALDANGVPTAILDENGNDTGADLDPQNWWFEPNISADVLIQYPGWSQSTIPLMYQVREPGLPPTAPIDEGSEPWSVTPGTSISGTFEFAVPGLDNGTYDIALKHCNHLASYEDSVVVQDTDADGYGEATEVLDLTGTSPGANGLHQALWAGDADGDDNVNTVYQAWASYPSDKRPEGDNDVDLQDYYTLYYQYQGGVPLTTARNADFDGDGAINLADYYGLYYGYQNNPDPQNWYLYPLAP